MDEVTCQVTPQLSVRVRSQNQAGLALESMLIPLPRAPLGTSELRLQFSPPHAAVTAAAFH